MNSRTEDPFGTIESAHDFMTLLNAAVIQTKEELQADVDREASNGDLTRRLDALRMALYNLEKLQCHLSRSSRILNDLRTLRRLLFEERAPALRTETRSVARVEENAA